MRVEQQLNHSNNASGINLRKESCDYSQTVMHVHRIGLQGGL
jgi:hypothetical protein